MKLYVFCDGKLLAGEGNNPEECIEVLKNKLKDRLENIQSINYTYNSMMKTIIVTFKSIKNRESISSIEYVKDWKDFNIYDEDYINNYFGKEMSRYAIALLNDCDVFLTKGNDGNWSKTYISRVATTFLQENLQKMLLKKLSIMVL